MQVEQKKECYAVQNTVVIFVSVYCVCVATTLNGFGSVA